MAINDFGVYPDGAFGFPACSGHRPRTEMRVPRVLRKPPVAECAVCGKGATTFHGDDAVCAAHAKLADRLTLAGFPRAVGILVSLSGIRPQGSTR